MKNRNVTRFTEHEKLNLVNLNLLVTQYYKNANILDSHISEDFLHKYIEIIVFGKSPLSFNVLVY